MASIPHTAWWNVAGLHSAYMWPAAETFNPHGAYERRAVVSDWREDCRVPLEDGSAFAERRSARGRSLSPFEDAFSALEADGACRDSLSSY